MTTYDTPTEKRIAPRTRRTCTESMTVVAHGDGIGMFDVFNADGERYVIDLAGEHDRCTCPDVHHNLEAGERCKHSRRVHLEFGLAPFEDAPAGIRSEHAAPRDVELAGATAEIAATPRLAASLFYPRDKWG